MGVRLIGTASTDEKAKLARDHGAAETIVYTRENFVERVKAITGGAGVALAAGARRAQCACHAPGPGGGGFRPVGDRPA